MMFICVCGGILKVCSLSRLSWLVDELGEYSLLM